MIRAFALLAIVSGVAAIDWQHDATWPKDPGLFARLNLTIPSIAVDNFTGEVYVAQRDPRQPSIWVYTREGDVKRTMNLPVVPHAIRIQVVGTQRFLWLGDMADYTAKKYTLDGELVKVLGTPGKNGSSLDPLQFDIAVDFTFDRNNSIYIGDGYGPNSRIVKLSPDYKLLWHMGRPGKEDGEFENPHSIELDRYDRLFVSDRGNNRIQIFRADNGQHLDTWNCQGMPWASRFVYNYKGQDSYFVAEGFADLLERLAVEGDARSPGHCRILQTAPTKGPWAHGMSVDPAIGAVYVANVLKQSVIARYLPKN